MGTSPDWRKTIRGMLTSGAPISTISPRRSSTAAMSENRPDRRAAVDHQGLAGDPCRVVGEQERDGARDVRRVAEPLERVLCGRLGFAAFVERLGEVRLDDGGGDRIDPDVRGELRRLLKGERDERALADAVEPDARGRGDARDG